MWIICITTACSPTLEKISLATRVSCLHGVHRGCLLGSARTHSRSAGRATPSPPPPSLPSPTRSGASRHATPRHATRKLQIHYYAELRSGKGGRRRGREQPCVTCLAAQHQHRGPVDRGSGSVVLRLHTAKGMGRRGQACPGAAASIPNKTLHSHRPVSSQHTG